MSDVVTIISNDRRIDPPFGEVDLTAGLKLMRDDRTDVPYPADRGPLNTSVHSVYFTVDMTSKLSLGAVMPS